MNESLNYIVGRPKEGGLKCFIFGNNFHTGNKTENMKGLRLLDSIGFHLLTNRSASAIANNADQMDALNSI